VENGKGIALITGASQGIGAATAKAFAAAGWQVVAAARSAERLAALSHAAGPGIEPAPCDVTDPGSVDRLVAGIAERHGRLDAVFCNAGLRGPSAPIGDIAYEDWRACLSVNLDGVFLTAAAAFRQMRAQTPQGGRIILNGSIAAYAPRPGSAPYAASKHAILGLTRSIALDGRPFDIAASQIDIGNAETPMTADYPKGVMAADGSIRPEPVMDVRHVADAVLRMAELPLDANVLFQTIMPTKMPFVGRG